ncbi:hypothetical protein BIW11_12040 [Tropilaelaps mercedesae]|uniref:Proteasome subunit beta type-3 n=1 Tax=Tropilaelaps mercedesae TaxID=418985 RepID=A0A1V9X8S2_9ACAR|nr:hypothetical protein BIW11_12040 [Tropilaelaps mercedesae]
MSIESYFGGVVIAMTGKECVGIASDRRFGARGHTISTDFERIFEMGSKLYLGLPGLATDTQTVAQRIKFRLNLFELQENRRMKPKTFSQMTSGLLYEHRFGSYYVEPVVAGLDEKTNKPFVCAMDVIGCITETDNFALAGCGTQQAYGMCETLWRPNMEPEELFESLSQALLNAMDREASTGWGAVVYIIEKDKVTKRFLKTRMD